MKTFSFLGAVAGLLSSAFAANSFAGSNLYYAAGLTASEQTTLFTGLQDAGVKVLRVWLDGTLFLDFMINTASFYSQPSNANTGQNSPQKGTSFTSYPSLEGDTPKKYNDEVLNRLDDFMHNASGYGIKLVVSFHSYNALESNADFYGKYYVSLT